jgi:polysaccharide biosynthesis transport protein
VNNVAMLSWQEYWQIVRRRRWWLILPVAICWTCVWVATAFLPATYRSETLILVEQQKIPEHYVVPNVAADLQERLQSMTQQVLSRTRLRRIIDELHLYGGDRSQVAPDELVDRMRKDIKIELVEMPNRPDELTAFRIYYSGSDPRLTQQVTGALSSFFIDENLRAREKQSEDTTNFLDTQLQEARTRLEGQEAKLREFKGQHLGELPTQLTSNLQILAGLQTRLQDTNERLERAEQQKVYLHSLLSQYQALSKQIRDGEKGTTASPVALDDELDRLKRQLADLQAKYTDQYPDVSETKKEISKTEQLKKQADADLAQPKDANASSDVADFRGADPKTVSPMLEIRSQIKSNDLEIQDRKREIIELDRNVDQYKGRLNQTPVREQQLSDITRDYDQSRANYESLLAKSNQSELATNLEKRQQGEQFRIMDPPNLPLKPYWPNRLQLSLFGLAAGVVLGMAGGALAESVDDRVHQEKDLSDVARLPVLGIVPPLLTPSEHRRLDMRARAEVAVGVVMAMIIVGGTLVAFYRG